MKSYLLPSFFLYFLVFLSSNSILHAKNKKEKSNIYSIMATFGEHITDLIPYMFSHEKFKEEKSKDFIIKKLNLLEKTLQKARPHIDKRPITFKVSSDVLLQHIRYTKKMIPQADENYTRRILKQIPSLCFSCHTQDQKKKTFFHGVSSNIFKNDFEIAEFNYTTRNYIKALRYYIKHVDRFNSNQVKQFSIENLDDSLRKILDIYVRILKSPTKVISIFNRFLRYKNLSPYIKNDIKAWIIELNDWKKQKKLNKDFLSFKDLSQLSQKNLGNLDYFNIEKKRVTLIRLSFHLFRYLNTTPKDKEVPALLLWLSQIDRALTKNIFVSFSDLYLKECMNKYPQSPYAKKCFNEFKQSINFSFSGTRGTDIPKDLRDELNKFKKKIYK